MVAVGRSMLVIIWHLLADPEARFHDIGVDWHDQHATAASNRRKLRRKVNEIEAMGYTVTINPAA